LFNVKQQEGCKVVTLKHMQSEIGKVKMTKIKDNMTNSIPQQLQLSAKVSARITMHILLKCNYL